MLAANQLQNFLDTALDAVRGDNWQPVLDQLPVPVYTADAEGAVTYWNQACVDFAGREPQLGSDRWCVTWRLCTMSGEPLPHEQCPMAEAIRSRKEVRGKIAIALRPDGSRRAFRPYPTPYFDNDGNLEGAVNLLIDITSEQVGELLEKAARCRRLSHWTNDSRASEVLASMAQEYSETAAMLKAAQ